MSLNVQEVMLLDDGGYNVILNKPVTATPSYANDNVPYPASFGNDGVVDSDVLPAINIYHSAGELRPWHPRGLQYFEGMRDIRPRPTSCSCVIR